MDRQYIAFISYRHLPLDKSVAIKMHRRIEHYVIPKGIRENGSKKVGIVFRDQDELPTGSNLTGSIEEALDASQFLIVVCTPETKNSEWVQKEISYFLKHHDHNRILAVLAAGTPEESFPEGITHYTDESGREVALEPLAANIVADSSWKRNQLFRTESLRILAPLIGCAYDDLYRREHRYQLRRIAAASGTAIAVLAVFAGMLLNRNHEIQQQYRETQIKESETLSLLSRWYFQNGNYSEALSSLIRALPSRGNDRPYVADAEKQLAEELYLYRQDILGYTQSFTLDLPVDRMAASPDGGVLAAQDTAGTIHLFNVQSGKLLWKLPEQEEVTQMMFPSSSVLVLSKSDTLTAYHADTGEEMWSLPDAGLFSQRPVAGKVFVGADREGGFDVKTVDASGELQDFFSVEGCEHLDYSRFALSDDGAVAALLWNDATDAAPVLDIYDSRSGTLSRVTPSVPEAELMACSLCFDRDQNLILASADLAGDDTAQGNLLALDAGNGWQEKYHVFFELDRDTGRFAGRFFRASVELLECSGETVFVGSGNRVYGFDRETGDLLWQRVLPRIIITSGRNRYGNGIFLVTGDSLDVLMDTGVLGSDYYLYSMSFDYLVNKAAISGEYLRDNVYFINPAEAKNQISVLHMIEAGTPREEPLTAASDSVKYEIHDQGNGRVSVCEAGSNSSIITLPVSEPSSIRVVHVDKEHSLVLLFDRVGRIMVFNLANGRHLSTLQTDGADYYRDNAECRVCSVPDESRLWIICNNLCIAVDRTSWEVVGEYEGVVGYDPEAREVVFQFREDLYSAPYAGLEVLLQRAKSIVEGC